MELYQPKNIVKEFMLGATKVRISDDYCKDKTPEDVDRILTRIGEIYMNHLMARAYNEEKQKASEKNLL